LSLATHIFFLVLLLFKERWSPALRIQISYYSIFRGRYDVPSVAVFGGELLDVFLLWFSHLSFVTIPVVPRITGIIVGFLFHKRCISLPL
jgi:hypothetical protein